MFARNGIKLLEEEIRPKEERITILQKDIKRIREELQGTLSCLDFSYASLLFLIANDKSILHHDNIQKQLNLFKKIFLKNIL